MREVLQICSVSYYMENCEGREIFYVFAPPYFNWYNHDDIQKQGAAILTGRVELIWVQVVPLYAYRPYPVKAA